MRCRGSSPGRVPRRCSRRFAIGRDPSIWEVPVRRTIAGSPREEEGVRYMLMVYMDQEEFVAMDPGEGAGTEPMSWDREMEARGVRRSGSLLRPAADATTVRVSGEEVLLTDGPFAEAKEQIAGYEVVECEDLDEAIEVASKHPATRFGAIEVRPFWE